MSDEPESKKLKLDDDVTGWEDHKMNVSECLMKADEGKHLLALVDAPVSTLQGIGPFSSKVLDALGITTIAELAKYKYFLLARALVTLSETETEGGRLAGSCMNVDKGVDKEYEAMSLKEICDAPTEALQGIGKEACELLETLGVKSIRELGSFKYCRWAEAIVEASAYEELKTAKERKVEAALKKLA